MTPDTPVTDADRKAAAELFRLSGREVEAINAALGHMDDLATVQAFARHRIGSPREGETERAVMVCPQCEGEGGYPDGVDEDACHTDCSRCGGNGWIVDLAALTKAHGTL